MVDLVEALSDTQRVAFETLRGGRSFAAAAEKAGVARMTVYRWVKSDAEFRAAYNAWRQELAESAQSRLLKLADKAVDCVEEALKVNDYGVAVTVLTKMGIMRRTGRGSIDPQVVRMQQDLEQRQEKFKAAIALMRHLLEKAGMSPQEQIQFIRRHGVDPSGLPGHELMPQLQDEAGDEGYDEDLSDDDLADELQGSQEQEDAADEPLVDGQDGKSEPVGQMAEAPAQQGLQIPTGEAPNAAEPLSRAG